MSKKMTFLTKEINLISLLSAFKSLNKDSFDSYLAYYAIKIRNSEL